MPARPTRHSGSPSARRLATVLAGGPPTAAFAVHLLTLVVALGALGWLGRPLWFFGDEWEFLVNRGGSHSPRCGRWNPPRLTRNSHSSPKNHSGRPSQPSAPHATTRVSRCTANAAVGGPPARTVASRRADGEPLWRVAAHL